MFGLAWAGLDAVARVEVTTDGGASWRDAELVGPHAPYSWTRWECTWIADHAGEYQLAARATSSAGRPQPVAHDPLSGAYVIHHVRPITVTVSAG
ncbi:MAG: hypothetical protein IPQ07_18645 [Myxococcales bacterium]|nr:hypothetical protein [Myxococcales bacterium]